MRVLLIISLLMFSLCGAQNPLASVSSLSTEDYALLSYSYTVGDPLPMDFNGRVVSHDIYVSGVYARNPEKNRTLRVIVPLNRCAAGQGWQEFNALLLRRYDNGTRALPQSEVDN